MVDDRSKTENALLELVRRIGQAWAAHDISALEQLIDDPYVHTDIYGQAMDRAEWLADVPDFQPRPTVTFDDMKVRLLGDTAVVTGQSVMRLVREGKATEGTLCFTQVWQRYGATWRRAAFHASTPDLRAGRRRGDM